MGIQHKCLAPRTWSEVLPGLENKKEPFPGKGRVTPRNLTFRKKTGAPSTECLPEATGAGGHFGCRSFACLEHSNDILPAFCMPVMTSVHLRFWEGAEEGDCKRRSERKRKRPQHTAYRAGRESHAARSHSCRITHAECKWQTIAVDVYATCSQPLHISTPRPTLHRQASRERL